MVRLLLMTTCFTIIVIGSLADIEREEHGHHHHHHHAHDGHDHHDHESHKNLFTGGDDKDENKHDKLRLIADKIDINKDGQVSRSEMIAYVQQRMTELNIREADDLIAKFDPDNTNKITFEAYTNEFFGDVDVTQFDQIDKFNKSLRDSRRLFEVDKKKWDLLDSDNDQALSHDEFRKFLRPEDHDELRNIEIMSMIEEYDENKDGKISIDEYKVLTEAEVGYKKFLGSDIDTNGDGYADFEECSNYYLPTFKDTVIEEAEHLLNECDTSKNGFCSFDEIVQAYSSFAGSQITDFGADLEKRKEEL